MYELVVRFRGLLIAAAFVFGAQEVASYAAGPSGGVVHSGPLPVAVGASRIVLYVTSLHGANLYRARRVGSAVMLTIPFAAPVKAAPRPTQANNARWYQVTYGQRDGYVLARFLGARRPKSPLVRHRAPPGDVGKFLNAPSGLALTVAPVGLFTPGPSVGPGDRARLPDVIIPSLLPPINFVNFPPNQDLLVQVTNPGGQATPQHLQIDQSGRAVLQLGSALPGTQTGQYVITAIPSHGDPAIAYFSVTHAPQPGAFPQILVTPGHGPPGTRFTIALGGFQPQESVALYLYRAGQFATDLPSVQTDASGEGLLQLPTQADDPSDTYTVSTKPAHVNSTLLFPTTATFVVDAHTVIMSTKSGGSTWQRGPVASSTPGLLDIACPSALVCYAVGDGGTILTSTDGGAAWKTATSGTTRTLRAVACPALSVCYAAGDAGTILLTTDEGSSWTPQVSGTDMTLTDISCPTLSTCYAPAQCPGFSVCYALSSCENPLLGCALSTAEHALLMTRDSGHTWEPRSDQDVLTNLSCPSAITCYAVGFDASIHETQDGGASWIKLSNSMGTMLSAISCPTVATCYAVGAHGTIVSSGDGGTTWQQESSGTTIDLTAIACPDTGTCYAVGKTFHTGVAHPILRTRDGGHTWTAGPALNAGQFADLLAISCPGAAACFAVGETGNQIVPGPTPPIPTPTPTPTATPGPIPVPIASSGSAILHGTWLFNFDSGKEGTSGDVWWEQETDVVRKLVPQGRAAIANLGVIDFDQLSPQSLLNPSVHYGKAPLNGNADASNQLISGDVFAVITNHENVAKVRIEKYGYDLSIRWVTYQGNVVTVARAR